MRKNMKKIVATTMALATLGATAAFAGCGDVGYKGDELTPGYVSTAAVSSNGGFAVEKGDYVYFINGSEDYTANNKYGKVTKAALMRIKKNDLTTADKAETVVPSLFVAQDYNAGIYIYGDYVYYASPTTDKNLKGEVENSWIDFKRAKIDGTGSPSGYFFRLASNKSKYRFVQAGVDRNNDGEEDVFCLYEEDNALKSYNTATGENVVLVNNASGSGTKYFYDNKDLENPNVYYTMAVTYDIDSDNATTASYNQLYCVNAAARVASVDASEASYTVENGKTYDFDAAWLKDNGYNTSDYTSYPYVNLGNLVLDGIGEASPKFTQFNNAEEKDTPRGELQGYQYTVSRYENGGVYFTRANVVSNNTTGATTKLYYLAKDRQNANSVSDNMALDVVATDSSIVASALFEVNETANGREHTYLYTSNGTLYRATPNADGIANPVELASGVSETLWFTKGEHLYLYGTGTNGRNIARINYKGSAEEDVYNPFLAKGEYNITKVAYVDFNDSWYLPEFFGDVVLYSGAQSFGNEGVAYQYIYSAKVGTVDEIEALNDEYKAYTDYKKEYENESNTTAVNLINYNFRTDGALEEVIADLYDEELLAEVQDKFDQTKADAIKKESHFITHVGKMTEDDVEKITDAWANSLLQEDEEEAEESGLPVGAVWAIVISAAAVVGAAAAIVIVTMKKKAAAKREAEATVNAYKRKKIDTTDDKTIDVYADETTDKE